MRSGEVEANLVRLNEAAKLPYIPDLIDRKTKGPEKGRLEKADLDFHRREYARLRAELLQAFEQSRLPEVPIAAPALNDLLTCLRVQE